MSRESGYAWMMVLLVAAAVIVFRPASAHPGSGIVIDNQGQIYFVDMVSGVWKLGTDGRLTHIPGPAFHWMTFDGVESFGTTRLPSGSAGDVTRVNANPLLIMASDFPIVIGHDSLLYYPSHDSRSPLQILRMAPSGQTSVVATLPSREGKASLRYLNGLTMGPDGSLLYTEDDAIRRISKDGQVSTVTQDVSLASCSSIPGLGKESNPLFRGLDTDSSGSIYVAATGCGRVLKVTPTGVVTIFLQVASPWSPTGVVVSGNIVYVLEFLGAGTDNRREMIPRIRKVTPDGKNTILATVTRGK